MALRILVAVDGSIFSVRAAEHVLRLRDAGCQVEPALLNVQMPLDSGNVRQFFSREAIDDFYRGEGLAALKEPSATLEAAGVRFDTHLAVGHVSQTIARWAEENRFDMIVIGTHGRTGLRHAVMGSVATDVIKRATVPVTVVKNA